jgi:hypothetical protein
MKSGVAGIHRISLAERHLKDCAFAQGGAMLRDVLEHIGKGYPTAKEESFNSHPLARFIRNDGPEEVGRFDRALHAHACA